LNVKDKVAIVTGASSGIGLATAKLLASKGAKVALVARSKEKLEALMHEIPGSFAVPADMAKSFEIKCMVKDVEEHFGRVDILVNNAGQGYDSSLEGMDMDIFRYIFGLAVSGPVVAMQQVIPLMRMQGGGAILNVSSAVALMTLPGMSPYASMKRALAQISLTAREELKIDNIIVSVAYPYITLTNFEKNTIREVPVPEGEEEATGPHPPDTADYTAQKLVEGLESGEAEIYSHDWQKPNRQQQR
jgi:short-subunit dehydrogenase